MSSTTRAKEYGLLIRPFVPRWPDPPKFARQIATEAGVSVHSVWIGIGWLREQYPWQSITGSPQRGYQYTNDSDAVARDVEHSAAYVCTHLERSWKGKLRPYLEKNGKATGEQLAVVDQQVIRLVSDIRRLSA